MRVHIASIAIILPIVLIAAWTIVGACAMAAGGAAAIGIRQAKREHLKPQTRVAQTVVKVVPVKGRSS